MKIIDEVMTFGEATQIWNLGNSTLRKAVLDKRLKEGEDVRKSGKVWLITRKKMIEMYGEPK